MEIIGKLGGKKLLVLFAALVLEFGTTVLATNLGITADQLAELLQAIMGTAGVFIVGQSVADGWSKGATSHVKRATELAVAKVAKKK